MEEGIGAPPGDLPGLPPGDLPGASPGDLPGAPSGEHLEHPLDHPLKTYLEHPLETYLEQDGQRARQNSKNETCNICDWYPQSLFIPNRPANQQKMEQARERKL